MSTFAESVEAGRAARPAAAPAPDAEDSLESVGAGRTCLMRFALALSALVIIFIDPSEPDRLVTLTYSALLAYTVYSGVLYLAVALGGAKFSSSAWTWVDVGSYLVFIALSSGTGSIFFYFFFFAILVASFRDGFKSGMRVTLVSAELFIVVGYLASPAQAFELNRFLMRPIYLLLLGYMIAMWGGSELNLKRRLALLKRLSRSANPRFGVDRTVGALMEEVRKFFNADTCLIVTQGRETHEYFLRRADRYKADRGAVTEGVAGEIGCQMASLLGADAVAFTRAEGRGGRLTVADDPGASANDVKWFPVIEGLSRLIGEESFMSVPWRQRDGTSARLYLTARGHGFGRGDLEFLLQVVEHVNPLVENMQLVDRLASVAAEQERRRISRDLHDSTIQPYIGLKIGLESVCRKAAAESPLAGDLRELLMRTEIGLADLRRYVHGLKRDAHGREEPALAAAVRQYAGQFTRLYGIEAACEVEPGLEVGDRLSAEAFQIVREGLSNVQRHTRARAAVVRLSSRAGSLVVEVEDDGGGAGGSPSAPFTPRSIRERSEALGGRATVDLGGGRTLVRAEVPF